MKKIGLLFFLLGIVGLSSCRYQRNNRIEQDDFHKGDERVYGDGPDAPARQLAKQYEVSPEEAARPIAIKEMLYGK